MMKKTEPILKWLSGMAVIILVLLGCEVPAADDDDNDDLPVKTIRWQKDGNGYVQFYTNDKAYMKRSYYLWDDAVTENPMNYFEAEVIRNSGVSNYGYGILFCLQDHRNTYLLLITNNGSYKVYKRVDGTSSHVYPSGDSWAKTSRLRQGYGVVNKLRVNYNGNNSFSIIINDSQVGSFTDTSYTRGMYGFMAPVTDRESFPNRPVDVRVKALNPSLVLTAGRGGKSRDVEINGAAVER